MLRNSIIPRQRIEDSRTQRTVQGYREKGPHSLHSVHMYDSRHLHMIGKQA